MEVSSGWNAQPYGREKFNVTVEEADVPRIFIEHGLPVERSSEVPAKLVFQLMDYTASMFAGATHVRFYTAEGNADQAAACTQEIGRLKAKRDAVLAEVRKHLGLPALEAA
jgi:hypothetical protein